MWLKLKKKELKNQNSRNYKTYLDKKKIIIAMYIKWFETFYKHNDSNSIFTKYISNYKYSRVYPKKFSLKNKGIN